MINEHLSSEDLCRILVQNYLLVILQLIKLQIILQLENTVNWLKNGVMTLNVSDTPVVPFSNLLAIVFFKKRNSLKKSREGCNWCVLCRR